jgi:hypothetical protein
MGLKLNKWYYKAYDDCNRRALIYLNEYYSANDSYRGYRICKVRYADGTTSTTIDDDYAFCDYDLENIEPCNNPMDIFEEMVNRHFVDWFGVWK